MSTSESLDINALMVEIDQAELEVQQLKSIWQSKARTLPEWKAVEEAEERLKNLETIANHGPIYARILERKSVWKEGTWPIGTIVRVDLIYRDREMKWVSVRICGLDDVGCSSVSPSQIEILPEGFQP